MVMGREGFVQRDGIVVFAGQQHLAFELGQVFFDRIVDRQFAFVTQQHDAHGRDGLGHRHDAKDGVLGHWRSGVELLRADRFQIGDTIRCADEQHGTADLMLVDKVLHARGDGGKLIGIEFWRRGEGRTAEMIEKALRKPVE